MDITYTNIDTTDNDFETAFSKYENSFFEIMSNAYTKYYGLDYHKRRIVDGKSILYLALHRDKLVGVSYVKRNFRRGGTAVFPESYRQKGIAESLVKLSLADFPTQYSILSTNLVHSYKMLSLMNKLSFKRATSVEEIMKIIGEEFHLLSNFRNMDGYLVFDRKSERRNGVNRELLTLTHTF